MPVNEWIFVGGHYEHSTRNIQRSAKLLFIK